MKNKLPELHAKNVIGAKFQKADTVSIGLYTLYIYQVFVL